MIGSPFPYHISIITRINTYVNKKYVTLRKILNMFLI
nr:MAG TPA: FACT complex subunit (SPT16/CDC68) [Caudoviricetes sp.]